MPSPVEYVRPEVQERLVDWRDIRAVLKGERAVKELGPELLPRPNPDDTSQDNLLRYQAYITRAVLYNASARTLLGMVGYVFAKEPTIELPPPLEPLKDNADGAGTTLAAQSKTVLARALGYGRCGMLVDYPKTDGPVSKAQLDAGEVRPTILIYEPEDIINWDVEQVGSLQKLNLLVLKEKEMVRKDDGFCMEERIQYRVIRRVGKDVTVEIHREVEVDQKNVNPPTKTKEFKIVETFVLTDKSGGPLGEIPFVFVGAESNDPTVDVPPILDLVRLNIGHYRNSADYEEACYQVGQPTAYVAGVTEGWVKDVWGGTLRLGSRTVIALPVGGSAGLLQVQPNSMPHEAMEAKEKQMISLGARLVEQRTVRRTATETMLDYSSDTSILSSAAESVIRAYRLAFKFAALFTGGDVKDTVMRLGEPLSRDILDPQAQMALVATWQAGAISGAELRRSLMRAGIAYEEDFVPEPPVEEVTEEGSTTGEKPGGEKKTILKSKKKPTPDKKTTPAKE
jgi:hypothetical protein